MTNKLANLQKNILSKNAFSLNWIMFSSKYLFFESQDCPWAFSSYYATSDSVPLFILSPLQCIALLRPCILLLAFSLNIVTITLPLPLPLVQVLPNCQCQARPSTLVPKSPRSPKLFNIKVCTSKSAGRTTKVTLTSQTSVYMYTLQVCVLGCFYQRPYSLVAGYFKFWDFRIRCPKTKMETTFFTLSKV